MLKVTLPSSQTHPLVRVTVKSPKGETTMSLDDSHSTLEVEIPNGVSEGQIEVTAQLCNVCGEPDERMEPVVLKATSETAAKKDPAKSRPTEKPTEKKADTPKSETPQR